MSALFNPVRIFPPEAYKNLYEFHGRERKISAKSDIFFKCPEDLRNTNIVIYHLFKDSIINRGSYIHYESERKVELITPLEDTVMVHQAAWGIPYNITRSEIDLNISEVVIDANRFPMKIVDDKLIGLVRIENNSEDNLFINIKDGERVQYELYTGFGSELYNPKCENKAGQIALPKGRTILLKFVYNLLLIDIPIDKIHEEERVISSSLIIENSNRISLNFIILVNDKTLTKKI